MTRKVPPYPGVLPATGFVRLSQILAPHGPIPIGKSTWWAGVKSGRFPKPVKLASKITVWRVEEIQQFIRLGTYAPVLAGQDAGGNPGAPPKMSDIPRRSARRS